MPSFRYVGTRHIHLEETDSTSSRTAEFAEDPAYAGLVITADVQSQGRGQYGRIWHSEPGMNVLLSALLFPPRDLQWPAVLTAYAAVCVARTIETFTEHSAAIKWPNDVLVSGKKTSGILIESGRRQNGDPYFVVGIGLNVNQTAEFFAKNQLPNATSLREISGTGYAVPDIQRALIAQLDDCYAKLLVGEIAGLEREWALRLGKLDQQVVVELMDANEIRGRLRVVSFQAVELELPGRQLRTFRPEEIRHLR